MLLLKTQKKGGRETKQKVTESFPLPTPSETEKTVSGRGR